jgi:aminomethyltransferase
MSSGQLRRTPLYECHVEAGARLVDFADWEMPVQYTSVIEEHRAVRQRAGLFDVSHMGEFRITGPSAEEFLQRLTPNDVSKLVPGQAHYSGLLTEQGTYIDDLLVYRLAPEEFLLVVNAANIDKDFVWVTSRVGQDEVEIENASEAFALLALQGPRAAAILTGLTTTDLSAIRYYRFERGEVAGQPAIISRTGYTGEDGFELYLAPDRAAEVWRRLLREGRDVGLLPAGLGARDTLRLEAGMALYGHELDESTTPLEAGLSWVVKLDGADFLGRQALLRQREEGVERRLVGFDVTARGIARQGHGVRVGERLVGTVTSGTWSPTLEKAIGMAYIDANLAALGTAIELEVRRRRLTGKIVSLPFYRRRK